MCPLTLPKRETLMSNIPWYHKTTIYQIYPRSFYDSNGDDIRKAKLLAMLQLAVRGVPGMPVHENYTAVNVERESKDEEGFLLNTVRTLLKLRNHEKDFGRFARNFG